MNALFQHIQKQPIRLDQFMLMALVEPTQGYYQTQNAIGKQGDFITAPEISGLFGDMLTIWLRNIINDKKPEQPILFVEIGAGRGSLMLDICTQLQKLEPILYHESTFHIIENSQYFTQLQQARLQSHPIVWHQSIDSLPDGFTILWGNEFLDALPIRQFLYDNQQWHETYIAYDSNQEKLRFSHQPVQQPLNYILPNIQLDRDVQNIQNGQWFEFSPNALNFCHQLAGLIKKNNGAALLIDYGDEHLFHDAPSLQSVKNHHYNHPLQNIGSSDLTAHVNFALLNHIFAEHNLPVSFASQEYFLTALGICRRAEQLIDKDPKQFQQINQALNRLIAPDQMGHLFKVMSINDIIIP
ncbi:MAG: SAM-dependent methyltransferase [Alphaproteobacteria bacterium]|nr:SAM-dependent methyltransferase [Alphaproteobacteria bacterium]